MGDSRKDNLQQRSLSNLISTYFERSTLEAELRAHKALSILHARDVQVEELQQRVAELQCAAAGCLGDRPPVPPLSPTHSRGGCDEAAVTVPPLRLPPSPGSDPDDAAVAASRALIPPPPLTPPSAPEESESVGKSTNSLVSDSFSNDFTSLSDDSNSAALELPPPPFAFAPSRSQSPHTPPTVALHPVNPSVGDGSPRSLPCYLATDTSSRRPGAAERESVSCMDIERQAKREALGRQRRKAGLRPSTQSYPIRAEHSAVATAAGALSEERSTSVRLAARADATAAAATTTQRGADGASPRSGVASDGGVSSEQAVLRRGHSSAAGDHASCHRLIDELKLYNNQLRAALLHTKPTSSEALGARKGEPVLAMLAHVSMALPPPPPLLMETIPALDQGDVAPLPPPPLDKRSDESGTEYSEVIGVATEAERLRSELQEVRRRFCDLQTTHAALQEQVRQQELVEQLKRKTMQELRERLAHLERSVAAGDLDTSDSEMATEACVAATPPQWLDAALARVQPSTHTHAGATTATRSVQATLCCSGAADAPEAEAEARAAVAAAAEERQRAAERDAEEQRQNNRVLAERLRLLSQAAAHEVEMQQQRCQKTAEKALRQRVRAICRTVADVYGLKVRPEELLRNPREASVAAASDVEPSITSDVSSASSRPRRTVRRSHVDVASRRTGGMRKQLRLLRVQYSRAKRRIAHQDRCLKAKQVYHTFLEKTLSKMRGEVEEMQRELVDTKMENDRLLQRVRLLEAAEAEAAKAAAAAATAAPQPAPNSAAGRRHSSKSPVSRLRRFSMTRPPTLTRGVPRTLSLPPRPPASAAVAHAPAHPASPGRALSPQRASSPVRSRSPHATLASSGAAAGSSASPSMPQSLLAAAATAPGMAAGGGGEENAEKKAEEAHRRQLLSARLRAATQNIAALNKAVSTLRHQLKASEESLQRCKERLIRSESCNQNRLMLVESYKVKTHDLEMRLDEAISKSNSQSQTIDALKNQSFNLKCQVSKIIAQRDEYMQEGLKIKKTLGEEITRTANEIQSRLMAESEQKVHEVKQQFTRHSLEQNKKLKEATQKLNQFGHAIEGFLRLVQQRQLAAWPESPAGGDDRPPRREALARAASILNLTPAQLRNFMNDPGEASRHRELLQWMTYCRRLFSREIFAQLLAEFLFKVVLSKFEPESSLESSVCS